MSAASGHFVWFDLMSTDVKRAKDFYSDVIGWRSNPWPGSNYDLWIAGNDQIGGAMPQSPDMQKQGAPSLWLGYIGTDDVDATVTQAQKLGGGVLAAARDIPDVGRFAVLADPQGASFAVFKWSGKGEAPDNKSIGHFGWAELNTTDWQAAWKFYSNLFGWKRINAMDMGPEYGEYVMYGFGQDDVLGGMSNTAKVMKRPAFWLHYVNVKNVDDTAKTVEKKGGKVLNGPQEVPGGSRIVQCTDPQGALFAMVSGPQ